jgi:DsbC/DsbD-like thiol-disulfide interchange protein
MRPGRGSASVRLAGLLLTLFSALALGVSMDAAPAENAQKRLVHARLVAETTSLQRNHDGWLAVELTIEPGWHVYWRNPGDAGLATSVKWKLPVGVTAGAIAWPQPERFSARSIVGYGYREHVALLAPVKVPSRFAPATVTVEVAVSWLACADVCIPGGETLKLTVRVGDSAPRRDAGSVQVFAETRELLPQPASFPVTFATDDERIRLRFARAAFAGVDQASVAFYPFDSRLIEHSAPQELVLDGQNVELRLRRSPAALEQIGVLSGLLVVEGSGRGAAKARVFEISARASKATDPAWAR